MVPTDEAQRPAEAPSPAEADAAAGEPDAAAAEPDAAAGEPDAATGEPDAAAGEPDAAAGEPDAAAGEPDAAAPTAQGGPARPAPAAPPAGLLEPLTLQATSARSRRLPPALRQELRREAAIALQRREAAEILARHGHPAEALRLARDAFEVARRAADQLLAAEPAEAPFPAGLALRRPALRRLERARVAARRDAPARNAEVGPEDEAALATLLDAQPLLDARLGQLTATPQELLVMRARRMIAAGLVLGVAVAALVWLVAPRREVHATASAWWGSSDDEHPRNAVDGDEATEWHLPDRSLGFLELRPTPPRDLRAVRLLDTRNPPFYDRATTRVRITAFSGDRTVGTREAQLPPGRGRWLEVPLEASDVDRLRIDVLAFAEKGAGLTEVELVER